MDKKQGLMMIVLATEWSGHQKIKNASRGGLNQELWQVI